MRIIVAVAASTDAALDPVLLKLIGKIIARMLATAVGIMDQYTGRWTAASSPYVTSQQMLHLLVVGSMGSSSDPRSLFEIELATRT